MSIDTTLGAPAIRVDVSAKMTGSAGVSIKIGCVKKEVADERARGRVDPLRAELRVGWNFRQVALQALTQATPIGFDWVKYPSFFPLDRLSGWLVQEFCNTDLDRAVTDYASRFHRQVVDLRHLADYKLRIQKVEVDGRFDSILMAIDLVRHDS